jgi:hypothetical protein
MPSTPVSIGETRLLHELGVSLRESLCGVLMVRLRVLT